MAEGILAAVNENGNIDRFIDTKGGVHYIEPKRYEESVAKIDAAATKAKETVNSATEAVSECKAQTGACTQETARAKEIADTVESRITGIEGDVAALRDSVSQDSGWKYLKKEPTWKIAYRKLRGVVYLQAENAGNWTIGARERRDLDEILPDGYRPSFDTFMSVTGIGNDIVDSSCYVTTEGIISLYFLVECNYFRFWCSYPV